VNLRVRIRLIIYIIRFFSILGLELFHFIEILHNRMDNIFFSRFNSRESGVGYITDRSIIVDNLLLRFSKRVLDPTFFEFLTELIYSRFNHITYENPNWGQIWERQLNLGTLNVSDYYSISKLLSRVGRFEFSARVTMDLLRTFKIDDVTSVFELFQIIKISLYNSPETFVDFIKTLGLYNYFKRFYSIDTFHHNLIRESIDNLKGIKILGPLRGSLSEKDLQSSSLAIIKPTTAEIEYISHNYKFVKEMFYYTIEPLPFSNEHTGRIKNVVDYHSKKLFKSNLKINYYSQFLLINGYPAHLQRALTHQVFELKDSFPDIHFVSFFLSNKHYGPGYFDFSTKDVSSLTKIELVDEIWRQGWHDFIANFMFCKFLYNSGLIESSSQSVRQILNYSVIEYATKMEEFYNLNL
jgi:hypothetical protein